MSLALSEYVMPHLKTTSLHAKQFVIREPKPEDTFSQFNPVHFTCGHEHQPTSAKVTHQVVEVWSPLLVQEDFPSATDFHTLPSLLCISSAGEQEEEDKQEKETWGLFKPDRKASVLWFYLDRQRL